MIPDVPASSRGGIREFRIRISDVDYKGISTSEEFRGIIERHLRNTLRGIRIDARIMCSSDIEQAIIRSETEFVVVSPDVYLYLESQYSVLRLASIRKCEQTSAYPKWILAVTPDADGESIYEMIIALKNRSLCDSGYTEVVPPYTWDYYFDYKSTGTLCSLLDYVPNRLNALDVHNEHSDINLSLVRTLSHEFRSPLNIILGLTDLLKDRRDGDATDEFDIDLNDIHVSAERLNYLVDSISDFALSESGNHITSQITYAVYQLSEDLASTISRLNSNAAINFDYALPNGCESFKTTAGIRLDSLLFNLLNQLAKQDGVTRINVHISISKNNLTILLEWYGKETSYPIISNDCGSWPVAFNNFPPSVQNITVWVYLAKRLLHNHHGNLRFHATGMNSWSLILSIPVEVGDCNLVTYA